MHLDLTGRCAVVTGASRGLGESIALALGEAGANLVLISRTQASLEEVAGRIREKSSVKVKPLAADVTSREEIERVLDETLQSFGSVDILVNNAGVNVKKNFFDISEDEWDYVLNTNLKGAYICSQVIGRQMVKQKSGKVVNIASLGSLFALVHSSPYCASKGALVQLTKVLAVEWAPFNVNVNAIAPGYIETEMVKEAMKKKEDLRQNIINRTPQKRFGKPEEIASAVVFLASDAASYITGALLSVDGGMSAFGV